MKAHYQNVLLGSAVLAALTFGFVSCSSEDEDDDYDIIQKVDSDNYTVNFKNDNSVVSTEDTTSTRDVASAKRGYEPTKAKHLGGIVQITFNKDSLANNGAMGYIWDLESDTDRAAKNRRRFCIAGLRVVSNGNSYYAQPYVSIYKNVVDIQAVNFGTNEPSIEATEGKYKGIAYKATEDEKIELGTSKQFAVTPDDDGVTVTIKVEPVDNTGSYSKNEATKFNVGFYNGAYDETTIVGKTAEQTVDITASELGYTKYLEEKQGAVYANVYAEKTLNGSWHYAETYADADVVEE